MYPPIPNHPTPPHSGVVISSYILYLYGTNYYTVRMYLVVCSAVVSHGFPVDGAEGANQRRLRRQTLFFCHLNLRKLYALQVSYVITRSVNGEQISYL